LTDEVVAGEDIAVIDLEFEDIIVLLLVIRGFKVEKHTIIEGCAAVLAPPMSVRFFLIIVLDPCLDKHVACSFHIFTRHILGVVDRNPKMIILGGLWCDIPHFT